MHGSLQQGLQGSWASRMLSMTHGPISSIGSASKDQAIAELGPMWLRAGGA